MTTAFRDVFEGAQSALQIEPAKALATFEASSRQIDGLRSEVKTRHFTLTVDEPTELGGTDRGPNPVELTLAALASCQEITYRLYADSLGIPLDGVAVTVSGDIDLRGLFAVDEAVRPGFQTLRVEVNLDSPADETDLQRLRQAVDQHCPVLDLLKHATPVSLQARRADAPVASAAVQP